MGNLLTRESGENLNRGLQKMWIRSSHIFSWKICSDEGATNFSKGKKKGPVLGPFRMFYFFAEASTSARKSLRRILPTFDFGSSALNSIDFGTL